MTVLRRSGPSAAARPAAAPRLEALIPYRFTAADGRTPGRAPAAFHDQADLLYGLGGDTSWAAGLPAVSYHDMARAIARDLAGRLDGVDLVITVEASPDCRNQSSPACVLADLLPGEPLVLGICEQGVAGPFTALRTAAEMIGGLAARRALVVVLEQSTLPPGGTRPPADLAVALLVGAEGDGPVLGRPTVTVTGRFDTPAPVLAPYSAAHERAEAGSGGGARTLVLGEALADLEPAPGVAVRHAEGGHPCAGVWLALADLLADGAAPGESVLIADRDPRLPYVCSVLIFPAGDPATPVGTNSARQGVAL